MTTSEAPTAGLPSIEALGLEFARVAAEDSARRAHRVAPRRSWRLAVALGTVAALTAASFTPPGRAVAEQVGEFIGLVDDGGSVVIGLGETPKEQHPYRITAVGDPQPGETCVFLQFKEVGDYGMGSCLAGDVPRDLAETKLSPLVYWPPEGLLPRGSAVLQGLAAPDIARIGVSYRDSDGNRIDVPVDVSDLNPNLLEKARVSDPPTRFFVAFLPPEAIRDAAFDKLGAQVPGIEIRAFDSTGNQVSSRNLADLRDYESGLDQNPLGRLEGR